MSEVIAICGKGGVGKTALTALLARAALEKGLAPVLLVDADPVGGLGPAVGERPATTLGAIRERVVARARAAGGDEAARGQLALDLDGLVAEALVARERYGLIAMGRSERPGCYCKVNALLRDVLESILGGYALVLIDAEAGVEQLNRQVTRGVSQLVVLLDSSARSLGALELILELRPSGARLSPVLCRVSPDAAPALPDGLVLAGVIPEDPALRELDRQGRPLWELSRESPAARGAAALLEVLLRNPGG